MSIRLRLTIYWAAVLAGILAIAAFAAFKLFERQQWSTVDAALLEEADTSAHDIEQADRGRAIAIVRTLSGELDLGLGRRVRLVTANQVLADFGDLSAALPQVSPDFHSKGAFDSATGRYRYAVMPLRYAGQPAYLEDGVDSRPIHESIAQLRDSLLLSVPLILVLCVAGGYLLAGRALSPIASIANALAAIQPSNLRSRLSGPVVADEVGRLTASINALLDRVERASATERRFASDAAHELRTPLTVLRTGLEIALSRDRSADANRAALEDALKEVNDLCKIADELLMLSRLEGDVNIERQPVSLRSLLDEIHPAVETLAQAKEIGVQVDSDGDIQIDANPGYLRRLVINLLDNALKFTPANGAIKVRLSRNDGNAELRIADTGPGIDPKDLPFIFDRFFRGISGGTEGSGLGLSLCREIARIHGGNIVAHNLSAGGCEFVVTLPARKPEPQSFDPRSARSE
ncbi:MAG TPA: HAMP domain-containing sensor histidine kinase [Candidatus Binataceae bacterium]